MLVFLWFCGGSASCPMMLFVYQSSFHHESMSYFIRALHGLRMAAPRKVAIIGSGNW